MKTTRTTLFGLCVAAALAFGASSALAFVPREAGAICPRTSVGKCSNQDQCARKCATLGRAGSCGSDGCCYCPL
jgi:hypothetical protein